LIQSVQPGASIIFQKSIKKREEQASMATFAAATVPLPGRVAGDRRCVVARASATMAAPTVTRTHYEVLGVGAGASRVEIKAAYRRLAREVHPDAAGAGGDGGDEGFIRLHAAYATLADPDQRARYDRDVVAGAAMFRRATATSPGFRRRTWETDQCW
jgi:DnaJ-domain-containing protein 1